MTSAPIRVLLVDDFEPWRLFVRSKLQSKPEFTLVAEESDGLKAVQTAKELQPDLILLDLGLPTINGIEVQRRVHEVAPRAKILFVTQNQDEDVIQAVLSNGAGGYVLKATAENELLRAMDAVSRGEQFVSERLRRSSD